MSAPKAYSTLENQYDKHESKDGMKNYSVKNTGLLSQLETTYILGMPVQ
jgi:hypothetical protein